MINWLASYPKSGNTWVRALINAYVYSDIDINNIKVTGSDLNSLMVQASTFANVKDMSPIDVAYLRYSSLLNHIAAGIVDPLILKTHNANIQVFDVRLIPIRLTKSAVYLIRDPRDIVISYASHMGVDIDVAIDRMNDPQFTLVRNKETICHFPSSWSENVHTWINAKFDVTVIKYEDLLKKTEDKLETILTTFGFDIDTDKINKAVDLCNFNRLKKQEEDNDFREAGIGKFFNRGTSSHWKDILTDKQAGLIESHHYDMMLHHGYLGD